MASPVVTAALAETIVITYRDLKNGSNKNNPIPHLPLPSQYTSVAIVYGALAFFPQKFQNVAGAIGWGFVLATVLNLWTPGGSVKLATVNATAGSTPETASTTPPPALPFGLNIPTTKAA
jgi:hypothetical protein